MHATRVDRGGRGRALAIVLAGIAALVLFVGWSMRSAGAATVDVRLVPLGTAGAIDLLSTDPDDVLQAIQQQLGSLSDGQTLDLVVPGLSGFGEVLLASADVQFPAQCAGLVPDCFRIVANLPALDDAIGQVLPLVLDTSWPEALSPGAPRPPVIDLELGSPTTDVVLDELLGLVQLLFPGVALPPQALEAEFALDGMQLAFRWDANGDDFVDVTAGTEVGQDIAVRALVSATLPDGADPADAVVLIGFRADSTQPGADTIKLSGLLGGSAGTLAGSLEVPEFALGTAFPSSADLRTDCTGAPAGCIELRDIPRTFFDDPDDPNDGAFYDPQRGEPVSFPATLQFGAMIQLDSLGPEIRSIFGYPAGARASLVGSLGISVEDLFAGSFSLDELDLELTLPAFDGAAAHMLPDWLALDATTLSVQYEDGALVVKVASGVTVRIPDSSQTATGGQFEAAIALTATLSRDAAGKVDLRFEGASTNQWQHPYGVDWLTLTGIGAELDITLVPGDTSASKVEAAVTASVGVQVGSGAPTQFSVRIEGSTSPLSLAITASLDSTVTLHQALEAIGVEASRLPAAFTQGVSVGPASISLRISEGAGGVVVDVSFGATGSVQITPAVTFTGEIFFGFRFGSGTPEVTFGVRTSSFKLADLIGTDPFGLTLPTFGVVGRLGGTDGLLLEADQLTPEARRFFRGFGCIGDADCDFRLDLEPGAHFLAAIPLPEGLRNVLALLWVDPDKPSIIDVGVPLPGGGQGFDLSSLSFKLSLPEIVPPEHFEFITRGRLSIEVDLGGPSLALAGGLDLRFRDDNVAPATTATKPDACVRSWMKVSRSDMGVNGNPPTYACYQELTASLSVGVSLGQGPTIEFIADLSTPAYGWPSPFGLDFLVFNQATLQFDIKMIGTNPSFGLGVLGAGSIFGKDFSGSIALGFTIISPAPTPAGVAITPEFRGLRFASVEGFGTNDLFLLYDALEWGLDLQVPDPTQDFLELVKDAQSDEDFDVLASVQKVRLGEFLGIELPPKEDLVAELALPDLAFRNIEVMVGLANLSALCIEPGLKLAGELHVGSGTFTPQGGPLPPACNTGIPVVNPTECDATPGCLASVLLNVTLDGIVISGSVASFELPVLSCDALVLDIRLTLEVQRFLMEGGCEVPGLGTATASIRLGLDGLAFAGELVLFPDSPGLRLRALIEGEAAVTVNNLDFSNPAAMLGLPFDFHAVLQNDFTGPGANAAEPALQLLRTTGLVLDDVLTRLETGDDPLRVIADLPATLQGLGQPVPDWVAEFGLRMNQFLDTLAFFGVDFPTAVDAVLGGFDVDLPGVPGFWSPTQRECRQVAFGLVTPIPGTVVGGKCYTHPPGSWLGGVDGVPGAWVNPKCYALPLIPGTVVGGVCWAVPPGSLHIPGLSELSGGLIPNSMAGVITEAQGFLSAAIRAIPGVPDTFDLTTFRSQVVGLLVNAQTPLLALPCVDFRFASTPSAPEGVITLRLQLVLLGQTRHLHLEWDFSKAPGPQFPKVAAAVVGQLFGGQQPPLDNRCEPFGTTTLAGTGGTGGGSGGGLTGGITVGRDLSGIVLPPTDFTLSASPGSVKEGTDPVTVTATLNRDVRAGDDAVEVEVDWGDGSEPSTIEIGPGTRTGTAQHTYADDRVPGTSADLETIIATSLGKTRTTSVLVENVAPSALTAQVLLVDDGALVVEGSPATLVGSFTDPGLLDVHTLTVRWGDGTVTVQTLTIGARSFELTHTYRDDNPPGTSSDVYQIQVSVDDGDLGVATTFTPVTVHNVAPTVTGLAAIDLAALDVQLEDSDDVSPFTPAFERVEEGALVEYEITWDDPGDERRYTVTVDWGDGTIDTYPVLALAPLGGTGPLVATGPAPRSIVVTHVYLDDDPSDSPVDTYEVTVTVADDDLGQHTATFDLDVHNVDPTAVVVVEESTVDEGGWVTIRGEVLDPGILDTFVVTVDWGHEALCDVAIVDELCTEEVELDGNRQFTATRQYGDNGEFTITVTVVDDDTGTGVGTTQVVVLNVDPTIAIDDSVEAGAVIPPSGIPTFITREGQPLSLTADAADPGSDDLQVRWDWADGTPPTVTNFLNDTTIGQLRDPDGWFTDPLPSPDVNPRAITDTQTHTWAEACLYIVTATVIDDDGGFGSDDVAVVVTGTDHRARGAGFWHNEYVEVARNRTSIPRERLVCYLDIVKHMSSVFGDGSVRPEWALSSFAETRDVLNTATNSEPRQLLARHLLAAYLAFAHGAIPWDAEVRAGGGDPLRRFHDAVASAEGLLLDPLAAGVDLLRSVSYLQSVNAS